MPFDGTEASQKYCVRWRDHASGYEGRGELMCYTVAKAWADFANREYPYISHWVEPSAT